MITSIYKGPEAVIGEGQLEILGIRVVIQLTWLVIHDKWLVTLGYGRLHAGLSRRVNVR